MIKFLSIAFMILTLFTGCQDETSTVADNISGPVYNSDGKELTALFANAGQNRDVYLLNTVALNGGSSADRSGFKISYKWSFVSKPSGSKASLSNATSVSPTFIPDQLGVYQLKLVINNGYYDSPPSHITINAIYTTIADAGKNQNVDLYSKVQLDGSQSSDSNGAPLQYKWRIASKPLESTATLSDTTALKPYFTADAIGYYRIYLVVSNGTHESQPSEVTIGVTAVVHKANLALLYSSNNAIIEWNENYYKDAIGYRVEKSEMFRKDLQSTWIEVSSLVSGARNYAIQDYTLASTQYRVISLSDKGLLSGENSETQLVATPLYASSIYFTQDDLNVSMPLNKIVTVHTITDKNIDIENVTYYMDTVKIGESSKQPDFAMRIDTSRYTDGTHRVDTKLKVQDSSYSTFFTPVETQNTNLNLSLRLAKQTGLIPVIAIASSKEKIEGVKFYLDDLLVADIEEKNYCSNERWGCYDTNDSYMWEWNSTTYLPATYTIKATVSDEGGEYLEKNITHVLNNPPELMLTSPVNDSLVGNTLTISGSATDDQNETTITIMIGNQTIYSAKTDTFSTTYDMRGLAEKIYTIEVKATDPDNKSTIVRRNVLYQADSNHTIWKTLGKENTPLTINNGYLLYKNLNTLVKFHLATDTENRFDLGKTKYNSYGDVNNNGIITFYADLSHIFKVENNISKIGTGQHPILDDHYSLWIDRYYSKMHLYSFATQETLDIDKPINSNYWLNWSYYLTHDNFCASVYMSSNPSNYDLFVYNISNQELIQVTDTDGIIEKCQGIDESRLLYSEYNNTLNELYYSNLNNITEKIKLSDNFSNAKNVDGVIAWVDLDDNALYVLYSTDTTPQKINNATLREVKNGILTYVKNSKLFSYKNGVSTEIWPYTDTHYIEKEFIYIIRGSEHLIYQIKID